MPAQRLPRDEDGQGRARRPARLFARHRARVAVLREELCGAAAQRLLVQDRPVLQDLPGGPVSAAAAALPMLSVERHPRGGAVQEPGEAIFPPTPPRLRVPGFALERFGDPLPGLRPVAPGLQVRPAQARRHRSRGRRQAVVDTEQSGSHALAPASTAWSIVSQRGRMPDQSKPSTVSRPLPESRRASSPPWPARRRAARAGRCAHPRAGTECLPRSC